MAVTTKRKAAASVEIADGELSDEEIERLLAQATARLQARSTSKVVTISDEEQKYIFPKLDTGRLEKSYVSTAGDVATVDNSRRRGEKSRKQDAGIRKVEDPVAAKKAAEERTKATAGKDWFDLPRTNLTPELKRDLQLLKMRNVLDPHRHYKKDGGGKMQAPEFSQVGTIVEGPTEFFSGRIENRKRKRTFVEEVLEGEQETGRFKRKYGELQGRKTSGKKAFYKALKEKRKGGARKGG